MSPESFDAGWLALREGVDHRSRALTLLTPLQEWWAARDAHSVLDLGAGTGSNLRYLAASLPGPQAWTLVDHDARLLSRAGPPRPDIHLSRRREDLKTLVLDPDVHLVTASALLDLVSEAWLARLVQECARCGATGLFTLTYDGAIDWSGSADPMDQRVRDAVNVHQRGDKGFGPALGPGGTAAAEAAFRAAGYDTRVADSPWVLGADDAELVRTLVDGWAMAAAELLAGEEAELRAWATRRADDVRLGRAELTVGHGDLLALPPEAGPR
ncbi:MAG: class I SAM-dependent methyltransferase [Gemmatimonadota bacterium]